MLKFHRKIASGVALGALIAGFAATAAQAQQTAAAADESGVEEIIVRAQLREQNLQEVPISVAAVGAEDLSKVGAVSLRALDGLVPNVVVENVGLFPAGAALSMRGIGYAGIESSADPDVAVYVNGVYQSRNAIALSSSLDLENVEVLRGPQGTLYGRNAYAGVIALRTRRPDMSEFSGSASADIANYGTQTFDLVGNIPLVEDKVAFRLAARHYRTDGYYKNSGNVYDPTLNKVVVDETLKGDPVGYQSHLYLRPSLRFTPNDKWDINFIGEIFRERSAAGPSQSGPGMAGITAQFRAGSNPYGDKSRGIAGDGSDPLEVGYNGQGMPTNYDSTFIINDTTYDLGFGKVRGLFSYMKVSEEVWTDTDGENINYFTSARWQHYKSASAELQFVSDFSDRLDLTAGASYHWDKYNTTQLSFTDYTRPWVGSFYPFSYQRNYDYNATTGLLDDKGNLNPAYINNEGRRKAAAVYAQAEFFLTEPLSIVLGGRYTHEKKYGYRGQSTTVSGAGLPITYDFSQHTFSSSAAIFVAQPKTWDNFSPRVGVNYKANEDLFFYAFMQKAFKSGGFNNNASDRTAFENPFNPQKVTSIEGGFKSDWMDGKLRANLNLFYAKYKQLQRSMVTPSPTAASGVVTITTNISDVKSYGVELELVAEPTDDLRLFSNIGWNKVEYSRYCADIDGVETTTTPANGRTVCGAVTTVNTSAGVRYLVPTDYSNLVPIRAPRWDITAGFTYDMNLANDNVIELSASANHRSSMFVNLLNIPYSYRDPMTTVNASLTWKPASGNYSVMLWGRNITNEIKLLNNTAVSTLFSFQHPTSPRAYGATLKFNF